MCCARRREEKVSCTNICIGLTVSIVIIAIAAVVIGRSYGKRTTAFAATGTTTTAAEMPGSDVPCASEAHQLAQCLVYGDDYDHYEACLNCLQVVFKSDISLAITCDELKETLCSGAKRCESQCAEICHDEIYTTMKCIFDETYILSRISLCL